MALGKDDNGALRPVLITTSTFAVQDPLPRMMLTDAGLSLFENPHKRKLTEDEVLDLLTRHRPIGMIAGVEPLTARVLQAAGAHLRVVSRCGVGLDSVDLEAARKLGIEVLSTPDAPSPAVAELTLALMLCTLRRVAEADRALRLGTWKSLQGSLLGDKTVGIVGLGRIGARVASLCAAFGCRVLACDERPGIAAPPGVRICDLGALLRESDIVTIHVPLTDGTRGLLDGSRLAAMKRGAIVVNVSRGGIVDEEALLSALNTGAIGGAALDVFESEPYSGPLTTLPNVVLTSHMGSAAKECRVRMETEAATNLIQGLRRLGLLAKA